MKTQIIATAFVLSVTSQGWAIVPTEVGSLDQATTTTTIPVIDKDQLAGQPNFIRKLRKTQTAQTPNFIRKLRGKQTNRNS